MQYRQHIDVAFFDPIRHDEGQARDDQFPGAVHPAKPSGLRKLYKVRDGRPDACTYGRRRARAILRDVGADIGKMREGLAGVANVHRKAA